MCSEDESEAKEPFCPFVEILVKGWHFKPLHMDETSSPVQNQTEYLGIGQSIAESFGKGRMPPIVFEPRFPG